MEQVTANLSGKVRRATLDGRPHLVAPMSMLLEGVLAGSQGPLFYPDAEIGRDPSAWNGVPITLGHPVKNGAHVSARRPDVLERQGLGTVFEAAHNGKLAAEGWFDEEKTRRLAPAVLAALDAGRPVELSTGLYTDNEPAPPGSTHNGRPYTHVARNYRPDHLAVLVGQTGACSVNDGCGVLVNEADKGVLARLLAWLTKAVGAGDALDAAVANAQPRHPGTGNFLPTGADVTPTEEQRRLGHDALVQKASGKNPPNWAVDEALWEKAKEQAAKAGHEEDWPYVVGIYQAMGGKIEGKPTGNREGGATVDREKLLASLTANCGGCTDDDRAAFGKLSDATLARLAGNADPLACPPGMDVAEWAKMSDEEKKAYLEKKKGAGMAGNVTQTPAPVANAAPAAPAKAPAMSEWLASMPAEARAVWNNAVEIEGRERGAVLDRLVANASGEAQTRLRQRLQGRPLDELRDMLALLPPPPEQPFGAPAAAPLYWGAAGGPAANGGKDGSDNLLPEFTVNWGEAAKR